MREHPIGVPNRAAWIERSIGEVCDVISRGTAPVYVEHSSVRVIGQRCVRNSGFDAASTRNHDSGILKVVRAQSGDVLLNSTGTGTIGRSCVFQENGDFIVDGHVTVLRAVPTQADPRWINALLRSPWGQQHLESHCYTGSTNQIELSRLELRSTSIPLPPIAEQRRIGEILDAVDEQIGIGKASLGKLRTLAEATAHKALAQWRDAPDAVCLPLADLAAVSAGVTLGASPGEESSVELPYLRVANVQDGYIDTADMKSVRVRRSDVARYLLQQGDVLLTEGGDFDKLGRGAVWDASIEPCLHQNHVFKVRCNLDLLNPHYLAAYLASMHGKKYFVNVAKQTTNLASINSTQVKLMPIPMAPMADQVRLVQVLSAWNDRMTYEKRAIEKLRATKQGLMDDLLTGRVRVSVGAEG